MAIVSLKPSFWDNADGLRVFFPGSASTATRGGQRNAFGRNETYVVIDLTALPTVASGNKQIVAENVLVPNGAFIEDVQVITYKETTGANANLNVGLIDQDRSTEIDFDGLLAAADDFNSGTDLGGNITYSRAGGAVTTEGGALIGTKITNTGLLVAFADTADFTAGIVEVRVHWSVPNSVDV